MTYSFGDWGTTPVLALVFAVAAVALWNHGARQLTAALMMFAVVVMLPSSVKRGQAQRSYYGVYRVSQSEGGDFNVLTHGTTLHGAQRLRDLLGNLVSDVTPGTYYYPGSPMAAAVKIVQARLDADGELGRFGIVGLGAGSLSCYSRKHEAWRFFEIDPIVVDIAAKSNHFTFLANCQPKLDAVIGDARLTLAKEPDKSFDLIIVDAFTSDAVPVHLMTAEALQLYASKLTDNGVVVLHISNRYLDLDSVLGATLPLVPDPEGPHRLRRQGRRQLRPEHLDHRCVCQEPDGARPLPGGGWRAGLPSGRAVPLDGRRFRYPRPLPIAVAPLVEAAVASRPPSEVARVRGRS